MTSESRITLDGFSERRCEEWMHLLIDPPDPAAEPKAYGILITFGLSVWMDTEKLTARLVTPETAEKTVSFRPLTCGDEVVAVTAATAHRAAAATAACVAKHLVGDSFDTEQIYELDSVTEWVAENAESITRRLGELIVDEGEILQILARLENERSIIEAGSSSAADQDECELLVTLKDLHFLQPRVAVKTLRNNPEGRPAPVDTRDRANLFPYCGCVDWFRLRGWEPLPGEREARQLLDGKKS